MHSPGRSLRRPSPVTRACRRPGPRRSGSRYRRGPPRPAETAHSPDEPPESGRPPWTVGASAPSACPARRACPGRPKAVPPRRSSSRAPTVPKPGAARSSTSRSTWHDLQVGDPHGPSGGHPDCGPLPPAWAAGEPAPRRGPPLRGTVALEQPARPHGAPRVGPGQTTHPHHTGFTKVGTEGNGGTGGTGRATKRVARDACGFRNPSTSAYALAHTSIPANLVEPAPSNRVGWRHRTVRTAGVRSAGAGS